MKTTLNMLFVLSLILLISCSNPQDKNTEKENTISDGQFNTNNDMYDCDLLPSSFSSYEVALEKIFNSNFRYSDEILTTSSSWIRSAYYYSCDGYLGYFIIKTDKQYFIHENLPIDAWKNFKNSSSLGNYYSQNIKNRYQMTIY
jgi:hypothetical protein